MRARSYFLSTLKEAPADADVISQQYMIRAGMIKKLAAGVYTYMPVGLRTIRKIEKIIREEMDRAGAIELLMPRAACRALAGVGPLGKVRCRTSPLQGPS